MAQLFRRECSSCGFDRLRWFPGVVAVDVLGAEVAAGLLAQLPVRYHEVAQCWQCLRCEESGAFGPSEWDPF
ncbi:hypothetical protein [Nocardioides dongxiaopingii]|uniref:hypothetical protein n=1 Tax=Nocardioides dongxiaopingii TaxID=2576036 RepID=UPI0010C76296|nr:hypothetical protein [Nocardioides dongxiaopingii]